MLSSSLRNPQPISWSINNDDEEVENLLKEIACGKRKHISLVVGNRVMAAEIYQLIEEKNLKVPSDVSILTFISRGGFEMKYPISTYDFSSDEMGRMIALVIKSAESGHPVPVRVLLSMTFKDEGSV